MVAYRKTAGRGSWPEGTRLIFFDYADPAKRVEDRVFEPGDWLVVEAAGPPGTFFVRATDALGRYEGDRADAIRRREAIRCSYLAPLRSDERGGPPALEPPTLDAGAPVSDDDRRATAARMARPGHEPPALPRPTPNGAPHTRAAQGGEGPCTPCAPALGPRGKGKR